MTYGANLPESQDNRAIIELTDDDVNEMSLALGVRPEDILDLDERAAYETYLRTHH